ncbi:DsbA family protein [Geomonas sp. RF6]|nr:DsbA family protein [Geomonas sp. RF6]
MQLKRELPELSVVWRAFELRPEPVPTLDPGSEYLVRVWNQMVYPMARQMGIQIELPTLQPRSRLAHEGAAFAREHGRFEEYHNGLFRIFFQRSEDIGHPTLLASLGGEVGLDADALRDALDAHVYQDAVLADEELAEQLGINAVPAFVVGRSRGASGVLSVDALRDLVLGR